ncbi:MAG TPA: efflux RND transporter permease subunit [Verrucomicrobiae bacterium]|nr:efflux RND transporter permease subunit [Verrucomicrobiae bacterium]
MVASFILSSTLVPILSIWFLRGHASEVHDASFFGKLQKPYTNLLRRAVTLRWAVLLVYLIATMMVIWLVGRRLGTEIFPTVDSGQLALRVRMPTGTRIENTEQVALKTLDLIKREAGPESVAISVGLVGVHAASYPINLIHLWNSGPEEAYLQIQLKPTVRMKVAVLKERLRAVFATELPEVRVSFEPSDIVSRVMSFGSPTPIEVAVQGPSLAVSKEFADKIYAKLKQIPALRDVHFVQSLDFPTVDVNVNRERAGLLGVKVGDVTRSLVAATTSSRFTVPNYWADPNSGVSYQLQVQIPQTKTTTLEDVKNVSVTATGGKSMLLRNVAAIAPGTAVGQYDRYNMARVVSMTANIQTDLGSVMRAIARIEEISDNKTWPAKTRVDVRGRTVPMQQLLDGFRSGLVIAVVVIFLMLTANFQSLRLSLAVVSTVPAVIAGVVLILWITGTTLNIQSAVGAIMAVGVAVANAILLVTFAERARITGPAKPSPSPSQEGSSESGGARPLPSWGSGVGSSGIGISAADSAVEGARSRLRPILMTSFAMIAGMLPLALGFGEGGDQTAPLGRAVVGGLALATLATLLVLPSAFAILASRKVRSPSLDPEDPASGLYEMALDK